MALRTVPPHAWGGNAVAGCRSCVCSVVELVDREGLGGGDRRTNPDGNLGGINLMGIEGSALAGECTEENYHEY